MDIVNSGIQNIGKLLILIGIILAAIGCLILLGGRLPWLGRLPGDILIQKRNVTFYFPLATGILVSIVLSFLLWLLGRR